MGIAFRERIVLPFVKSEQVSQQTFQRLCFLNAGAPENPYRINISELGDM